MAAQSKDWSKIPSLDGLKVDWDYKTDQDTDKRVHSRITSAQLSKVLGGQVVQVKVVSRNCDEIGNVVDIARQGIGISLQCDLVEGESVKVGFILGKHKVISKGQVKNVTEKDGAKRVGIEFIDLPEDAERKIAELIKLYEMTKRAKK